MPISIIISITLLLILAGIAKTIADISSEVELFDSSRLRYLDIEWWCKDFSFDNKWKKDSHTIERFPFSSTILVGFTDAWHLFNLIIYTCFAIVCTLVMFYGCIINIKIVESNAINSGLMGIANFVYIKLIFLGTFSLYYKYMINGKAK